MNDGFNKALQICNFRCWYFVLRCLVVCYTCKFSLFPHLWSLWRECKSVRHDEIIFFLLKIHIQYKNTAEQLLNDVNKIVFLSFYLFSKNRGFSRAICLPIHKKVILYFLLVNVKNRKGLDNFGFNSFSLVFWRTSKGIR